MQFGMEFIYKALAFFESLLLLQKQLDAFYSTTQIMKTLHLLRENAEWILTRRVIQNRDHEYQEIKILLQVTAGLNDINSLIFEFNYNYLKQQKIG